MLRIASPSAPATCCETFTIPEPRPASAARHVLHRDLQHRHEGVADAQAHQEEADRQAREVVGVQADAVHHVQAKRDQQQTADHHAQSAEAGHQPAGDAHREHRHRQRPRHERKSGLDRVVVQDVLEVEASEEPGAVHAGDQEPAGDAGHDQAAIGQDPQRHDRVLDAGLQGDEGCQQGGRDGAGGEYLGRAPAMSVASTIAYTAMPIASVTSSEPSQSTPCLMPSPLSAGISARPASTAMMPIGRLTKKIQCQLSSWVSTPPASSPSEPPATAVKT